jgi:methyltransferase family protein
MANPVPCFDFPSQAPEKAESRSPFSVLKQMRRSARLRPLVVLAFKALQRAGINVTPQHFYWPIPDLRELERRAWPVGSAVQGLDLALDRQLEFLATVAPRYASEIDFPEAPITPAYEYHRNNGLFESYDAEILYLMLRHLKPRRIIEIGCGFSTRVAARAVRKNLEEGAPCELIAIEPYPDAVLRAGFPGLTALIATPVQQVDPKLFQTLERGDILSIDSSHVVAIGSDVVYEYLEVIPRLRPGVVVHLHDIFLPDDYPRAAVLDGLCFWSEQYLLQAFLCFNPSFEVFWASSAMQIFHRGAVAQAFPAWLDSYTRMPVKKRQFIPTTDGRQVWPSSFWMRSKE